MCAQIEALGEALSLSPKCCFELNLALEEHFTNVISHAYTDGDEHWIQFHFSYSGDSLTIRIEDDGQSFDPRAVIHPDTQCAVESRDIGGLGIHLIKKLMDDIRYLRCQSKNIITLTKKI